MFRSADETGDTRQQQHLLGAYSFASSSHIDLNVRGLAQAGTWNYLREEITMALELQRPVRMGNGFEFLPSMDMADDMWANYISYILARVINFCFDDNGSFDLEDRGRIWQELIADVSAWRSNRPGSFDHFSTTAKDGNAFPSIWLLQPWHGKFELDLNEIGDADQSECVQSPEKSIALLRRYCLRCQNLIQTFPS